MKLNFVKDLVNHLDQFLVREWIWELQEMGSLANQDLE